MSPRRPKLPSRRTTLGPVVLCLDDIERIVDLLTQAGETPTLESETAAYDTLQDLKEHESSPVSEIVIAANGYADSVHVMPHRTSLSMTQLSSTRMKVFIQIQGSLMSGQVFNI